MARRRLVSLRPSSTRRSAWTLRPRHILLGALVLTLVALVLVSWLVSVPLWRSSTTTATGAAARRHGNEAATASAAAPATPQQYVRYNKRGKEVMHRIDRVRLEDLRDLTDDYLLALTQQQQNQSFFTVDDESIKSARKVLLDELHRSGIRDMDAATMQLLPTWQEVSQLYYRHVSPQGGSSSCEPIIYGLDKCRAFARRTPAQESFLATAGLYNTGTNALTYYLRANLQMSGNPLYDGVLVQVPWHKHWFVQQRHSHAIPYLSNISLSNVLPIVTIRDPLTWAQSMCDQPYDVEWTATGTSAAPPKCPSITNSSHNATIRLPKQTTTTSFANLWALYNAWYEAYLNEPRLDFVMVRHEDLLYCPRQVVSAIQACSGAQWKNGNDRHHENFVYVMDQAKWEHARESGRAQSNRVSAMIKHGHAQGRRIRHLTADDIRRAGINESLMQLFGYRLPKISQSFA